MARMLESDEAARRLGVKVGTLYAYVSRGLLVSHPSPEGRRSLFDVDEVERLARRSRQGKSVETRMATITTGITQLTDDGPVYRGRRAVDLATASSYEEVAEWLWGTTDTTGSDVSDHRDAAGPRWLPTSLGDPPDVARSDRMRWAVVMAGALDPLRADLRPESVRRTARHAAADMVAALPSPDPADTDTDTDLDHAADGRPGRGDSPPGSTCLVLDDGSSRPDSMAERLARALSPAPSAGVVRGVNAALVLLADHELATSTMAVRVAASTRAGICDALLAGLGTLAGPLHGGASQLAYSLLVDAQRFGVERALDDTLRWQGVLPGFGHPVYQGGDARFTVLFDLFEQMAPPEVTALVRSLVDTAGRHAIPAPNVDLGLAALAWVAGLPADAGRTLFAVARVAGWVAHYLEELEERPLRYRARAVYATPSPR
jgi:citrate synthase